MNGFNELKTKFEQIKKRNLVKSQRAGSTGIGYTFEKLLGKEEDSFSLPDYEGIEIKTKRKNSSSLISLFNMTLDGDCLFPIEHLRKNFGYPDKIIKRENVFMCTITNAEDSFLGNKLFKIVVDYEKGKVVLKVQKYGIIDTSVSWSFEGLKTHLDNKLKYLAFVKADNKFIDGYEYFHYYCISFYKMKDFSVFLKLLEQGKIIIKFKVGIFRSGEKIGKVDNHGTSFHIHEEDIPLLFDCVDIGD